MIIHQTSSIDSSTASKTSRSSRECDLSLVLPVVPPDYPFVEYSIRSSLRQNYVHPDEIILAMSSFVDDAKTRAMMESWKTLALALSPKVDLIAIPTTELKYAGANRQRGVRASSCHVVSFFDCDDVAHPNRAALILKGFSDFPQAVMLLHRFDYKADPNPKNKPDVPVPKKIRTGRITSRPHLDAFFASQASVKRMKPSPHISYDQERLNVHRGWASVRRVDYLTTEFPDKPRRQDYALVRQSLARYGRAKIVVLWDELGCYAMVTENDIKRHLGKDEVLSEQESDDRMARKKKLRLDDIEAFVIDHLKDLYPVVRPSGPYSWNLHK